MSVPCSRATCDSRFVDRCNEKGAEQVKTTAEEQANCSHTLSKSSTRKAHYASGVKHERTTNTIADLNVTSGNGLRQPAAQVRL